MKIAQTIEQALTAGKENRRYWLWLSFLLPLVLSFSICISLGVWPFGQRCILHMDMYHQYCPFFTEFLRKLKEGGSLFYSWNIGLGSDFFAVYVYYLSSPLNWLLLLCPRGYVIEFMTLMILFKMAMSSLGFYVFADYHFGLEGKDGRYHARTSAPVIVAALAYAFCGFVAAYHWDIMWMDCIALFPFVMKGLKKLVTEGRPALYYVTLTLCILSNYYLSIMICIFLVFYFLLLWIEMPITSGRAGYRRRHSILWFAVCSLLAGGSGAVLMLPEMIILGYSGSSGFQFPETMEWYFGLLQEFSRMGGFVETYTGNDHWPNLYTGIFTLLLLFLYLFNRRIPLKQKLPRFGMVCFLYLSFANNWLDFIWHGLHFPDSLPARQSFLFSFLLLMMAVETWRKRKGTEKWHILAAVLLGVLLLVASAFLSDAEISSKTALSVSALLLVGYGSLFLIGRGCPKRIGRSLSYLACGLAILELFTNMAITGFQTASRSDYLAKVEAYEKLIRLAEEDADGQFFRMEDTERLCKNDDTRYGYPSATQFSSLMNINVSHFYQSVFMEGGKNYYCYNGATPLTSAMLSVRYFLSDNPSDGGELREYVGEADGQYLYRNRYCLPLGYVMPEESVFAWEQNKLRKIEGINALADCLGASSDLLVSADASVEVTAGETWITLPEDGYYYAASKSCKADSLTIEYEDGRSVGYSKTTHSYLFDLGYCKAGTQVRIRNRKQEIVDFNLYQLDRRALDEAYASLNTQTFLPDSFDDTHVEGHILMTDPGRLIFSIAAESGWTLTVDGIRQEILPFAETFISIPLEEGEHQISLSYETPGFRTGALISGGCLLLFVLLWAVDKKYRIWK